MAANKINNIPRLGARQLSGLGTMAIGTFAMVTVEGLPVGLLPAMGKALRVSQGMAGLAVTVPGLVAAASAILLPMAIRSLDRRLVLVGLLATLVVANLVTAVAGNLAVLLASRVIVGVVIGGFWSLAATVAVRLVPARLIPRALSITFAGATAASVIGIPLGTLIGTLSSWRVAFLCVAGLALVVAVAMAVVLPGQPVSQTISLRLLARQFTKPGVRGAATATLLLVGGHYVAFTYVSTVLLRITGIDQQLINVYLLGFGVGAMVGTMLVGRIIGGNLIRTITVVSLAFACALAIFPLAGSNPMTGGVLLIIWGLAFGGVPVALQSWIVMAAGEETEVATAVNTTAYNFAVAVGALAGGLIMQNLNVAGILLAAAVLIAVAAAVAFLAGRRG